MNWAHEKLQLFFSDLALNLVMLLLLAVSCLATWSGLSDFMAAQGDTNIISGLSAQAFVGLIVIILTIAMYVALREVLSPKRFLNWVPALGLYLVLLIWSVGFGYGFWWSLLAGNEATDQSMRRAMSAVERQAVTVQADISAIGNQLDNAVRLSRLKTEQEEAEGGTCGVASLAGTGRFLRARRETQSEISALSQTIKQDWLAALDEQVAELGQAFDNNYETATGSVDRRRAFQATYNELQRTASFISASARAQGLAYAGQLRNKSKRLSEAPEFGDQPYCYDPDLAATLILVAERLERSFEVNVPPFRFSDGTDGVARAVEDLWLGLSRNLIGQDFTPDGSEQRPILSGGRAITAFLAAVAIDLAIFVFAIFQSGRNPGRPRDHFRQQHRPTASDAEIDDDVIDSDVLPMVLSEPSHEPSARTKMLVDGNVSDAEYTSIEPDQPMEEERPDKDIYEDDEFEIDSASDLLEELDIEIRSRLERFDNIHTAALTSVKAEDRRAAGKEMKALQRDLAKRFIVVFGRRGQIADDDCTIYSERHEDGEPGQILEVLEYGFRHKRTGQILRKAKVVVVADP